MKRIRSSDDSQFPAAAHAAGIGRPANRSV
jgi:hypothetical protein